MEGLCLRVGAEKGLKRALLIFGGFKGGMERFYGRNQR